MALSGWDSNKKIKIAIPAQAEELTDFTVQLNLTAASGTTDFDCSAVFDELGNNSKKLAIEYGDTGQQCFVEIERWDAANKSAQLWCRVPTLPTTGATLNLYYDATKPDNDQTADPHWSSVVLAMPMGGVNNSTTFTDLKGKTVTRYGDAKISTAQSKFGGASAYFDGSGDYLAIPPSTSFDFGTTDFTFESWVCISGNSDLDESNRRFAGCFFIDDGLSNESCTWVITGDSTTTGTGLGLWNGSNWLSVNVSIPQNTFVHLACVRLSGTLLFFVNGVKYSAGSYNYPVGLAEHSAKVGGRSWVSNYRYYLNGYIDDLRITKGVARYTADFTPPDRSFINYVGDIGSHQGRQVWDANYAAVYHLSQDPSTTVKESTWNSRSLTPYGSMTTAQLTDGPTGKALALDGSNDYLATTATSLLGTGDLTVTALIYVSSFVSDGAIFTIGNITNISQFNFVFEYKTTGALRGSIQNGSGGVQVDITTAVGLISLNAWTHVAMTANGSTAKLWINGVERQSGTISGTRVQDMTDCRIGRLASSPYERYFNGRISRPHIVKGVARSAAWLTASYNSDFDQLLTFSSLANTGRPVVFILT